jgi:hypothetical protein
MEGGTRTAGEALGVVDCMCSGEETQVRFCEGAQDHVREAQDIKQVSGLSDREVERGEALGWLHEEPLMVALAALAALSLHFSVSMWRECLNLLSSMSASAWSLARAVL